MTQLEEARGTPLVKPSQEGVPQEASSQTRLSEPQSSMVHATLDSLREATAWARRSSMETKKRSRLKLKYLSPSVHETKRHSSCFSRSSKSSSSGSSRCRCKPSRRFSLKRRTRQQHSKRRSWSPEFWRLIQRTAIALHS